MNPADGAMLSGQLYIPIWFYSNPSVCIAAAISFVFTFQSGSIQILTKSHPCTVHATLHSNLVLFKFCFTDTSFQSFDFFTFQSGSIQINMAKRVNEGFETLHSNLVLFK